MRRESLKVIDTIDVFSTKHDKVCQFGIEDSLALTAEEEASLLASADSGDCHSSRKRRRNLVNWCPTSP